MNKPLRPMKAHVFDPHTARYPLLASYKLDGIRCIIKDGQALSNTLKVLPNRFLQDWAKTYAHELYGYDGELVVGPAGAKDVFKKTMSGIMSQDGEPDFEFKAFDLWHMPDQSFRERSCVGFNYTSSTLVPKVSWLIHRLIKNEIELVQFESEALRLGFEGIVLRDPEGPYKYGRSTEKQGWMGKLKRWEDAETMIIGFEELMHNENPIERNDLGLAKRGTSKANMVSADTLGTLLCQGVTGGNIAKYGFATDVQFGIGSGLDDSLRQRIWNHQEVFFGGKVKFKFFGIGTHDKPRQPIFRDFVTHYDEGVFDRGDL